jgi:integrase
VGWRQVGGKPEPVRRTKGGFKTKTEALKYCQTLLENPYVPKADESFEVIAQRWVAFYEPRVKESTMACYKAALGHFKPILYKKLVSLTVAEIQTCFDACPSGRSTKEDMRTVCSLIYKFAAQNGIDVKNPSSYLYLGTEKKGTREPLSMDELERIRRAVGIVPFAGMIYALCYLGYRPTEMLSLKKSDYDPVQNCFRGGIKTEAGKNRLVTISPKIQHIVDALLAQEGDYVFSLQPDKPITEAYFRDHCFLPAMGALGIEGKTPYSCRHTFANLLKAVRGSDTDKAALIGHADASMTKYYQSADYESLRAITDRI